MYEELFRKYAERYFEDLDWRWLQAVAQVESGMDPQAVSSAGAQGLMQVMPATWFEIKSALNAEHFDPFNPEHNILAGTYYISKMYELWDRIPDKRERMRFALASYNAGYGSIVSARRSTARSSADRRAVYKWSRVSAQLRRITGIKNAKQTREYVKKVEEAYAERICQVDG